MGESIGTVQDWLERAVHHHRSDQLDDAERLYRDVLEVDSRHPIASYNLGVLVAGMSRYKEALIHLRTALEADASQSQYWVSYIEVLLAAGSLEGAKQVLELGRRNGLSGPDVDQLAALVREAESQRGTLAEALGVGGIVAPRAVGEDPGRGDAKDERIRIDLASADAEAGARKLVERFPSLAFGWKTLGVTLCLGRRSAEALTVLEKALALLPQDVDILTAIARVLQDLGRVDEAAGYCERALAIAPDSPVLHCNLGNARYRQQRLEDACECYEQALCLKPDYANALSNLGSAWKKLGKLDKALDCLRRSLEIQPDLVESWHEISQISEATPSDPGFGVLERIVSAPTAPLVDRYKGRFTLGKMYHDIGDSSRAFSHYLQGQAARAEYLHQRYDHDRALKRLAVVKAVFTRSRLLELSQSASSWKGPIFVVGFPRSGTSLAEQILSSHSAVFGAGERKNLSMLASSVSRHGDLDEVRAALDELSLERVAAMAATYERDMEALAQGEPRIVDKMPHNFMNLWLVAVLFANAKIIHCKRSPLDTCLSGFFQAFEEGHAYTAHLETLGQHYRLYRDYIAHWQSVLPIPMHEVLYEDVVDRPESEIRRLLEHCDLEFEPSCLRFYETRRSVNTASAVQVRQRMYRSSLARWKRYEDQLAPLIEVLGPELVRESLGTSTQKDGPDRP